MRMLPVALAVLALTAAAALRPAPARASTCQPFGLSGGYITSLQVKRVSCRTGGKVARAHWNCRHEHGLRGHCTHRVRHYRCTEGKRMSTASEIDARVTCRRGRRRVVFTYQQNY